MKVVGVLRGSAALVLGRVVGLPLGLMTTMLLARYLGVQDYGRFTTVLAFWAILSLASEMGVSTVVIGEIAKPGAAVGEVWLAGVITQIGFSAVAAMAGLALGTVLFAGDPSMQLGAILGVTFAFASMPAVNAAFQVRYRMWIPAAAGVAQSAVVLLTAYLGVRLGAPWQYFVVSGAVAGVVAGLLTGIVARSMVPWSDAPIGPLVRRIARFAVPVGVAQLFAAAYYKLDAVVVFALAGATEASYYNAAYRIYELALIIPTAVTVSAIPYAVQMLNEEISSYRSFTGHVAAGLVTAGSVVSVFVILGAGPLVGVIYGSEYADVVPLVVVMMFAAVARYLSLWLGWLLTATGRRRRYLAIAVSVAVVSLTADCLLVPVFGAPAAAVVTVVAECSVVLLSAVLLNGKERPGWTTRSVSVIVFGFLGVSAAAAVVLGWVPDGLPQVLALLTALVLVLTLVTSSLKSDLPALRGSGREQDA